jgi:hypothetical protein
MGNLRACFSGLISRKKSGRELVAVFTRNLQERCELVLAGVNVGGEDQVGIDRAY